MIIINSGLEEGERVLFNSTETKKEDS